MCVADCVHVVAREIDGNFVSWQYFTILLVILVGMVVTSALGYVYRTDVKSAVHDGITDGLQKYGNDTTYTNEIDFMQKNVCENGSKNLLSRAKAPIPQSSAKL